MLSKENIIEDFYGFMKYLLPIINKFPRDQKFILGENGMKSWGAHARYSKTYHLRKHINRLLLEGGIDQKTGRSSGRLVEHQRRLLPCGQPQFTP